MFYTGDTAMAREKTISISFRVSPRFKAMLQLAAAKENRSCTNMLEALLFSYCEQHSVDEASSIKRSDEEART
jgi:uncharacterized protein (DUF1778 family)